MLRKNVASQVLTFNLVNATTGAALTGATVTTKVALDGTQSAGAGTVTELGTGQYKYVPTQGETNGTTVGFSFTASNACPVNLHCFMTGQDLSAATLKVDVDTIKTNPVVNGGTITFPSNATLASTAGAVGSVTGAVGSVTGAVGSVTGAVGSVTGAVGSVTGNVGGNVVGSVASVVGAVGSVTGLTASDVGAIKAKTDNLPSDPADASDIAGSFTTVNTKLDTIDDFLDTEIADIRNRLPAALSANGNIKSDVKEVNDVALTGDGAGTPWGPA